MNERPAVARGDPEQDARLWFLLVPYAMKKIYRALNNCAVGLNVFFLCVTPIGRPTTAQQIRGVLYFGI